MQWQALHLRSDFGETAVLHSTQPGQQTKGQIDRFLPRALEPIER